MPSRKRSPHPGIVVLKPQPETRRPALIRWRDPATQKFRTEKLPELPAKELRKWLRTRSYELEGQRLQLGPIKPRVPSVATADVLEKFFGEIRVADSTAAAYRRTVDRALAWPDMPKAASELSLAVLRNLRAWLNRPDLAAATVNFHLCNLSVILRHSRLAGRVPLDDSDIKDGLAAFRSDAEKKTPLSVEQIRQLVIALNGFIGEAGDAPAEDPALFRGYVLTLLLGGERASEARALQWDEIHSDHIWLPSYKSKTRRSRKVTFAESPSLPRILQALPKAGSYVFPFNQARASYLRNLVPVPFDWTFQQLRVTCGSYLTCAPGIYGGASAYMSAARLGHSVQIAERHYVNTVSVPATAKTLEDAYNIADLL